MTSLTVSSVPSVTLAPQLFEHPKFFGNRGGKITRDNSKRPESPSQPVGGSGPDKHGNGGGI